MTCNAPIAFGTLVEYWLGELDEATELRLDEHLLGCGACSAALAEIVALAGGIRTAFERGAVRAFLSDAFVRRLVAAGVRLREYRVPLNGSVDCTVTPEDDLVVSRLEAPLAGVTRLDAAVRLAQDAPEQVFHDIPFDAGRGEVVVAPSIAHLRTLPSYQHRVRLIRVEPGAEQVIGEYVFNHTAWTPAARG